MTPDENERLHADWMLQVAIAYAQGHFQQDVEAAAAAMIARAFELATPDLSPNNRASIFMDDEG